ncbi:methyltransferase domain-containing protein [Aurantibacillus circumpalustris]|uniref:methyltransferase domain-containing protein n=1 Tax=Aurantibacillus circumpalustris TaxID=3036359 RepID=UPI00295AE210|nr:methyltransferase domain-containing protein [Aurantibacillus circumpalustris]
MFKKRSDKKELLDADNIPENDLFQNLKELDTINSLLGGYKITFSALKKNLSKNKQYTIVDIGSGGGDTLKHIYKWSSENNYQVKLFGVDLKQTCIDYSIKNKPNNQINFICDDYRNVYKHTNQVDIIHASLFCHHLSNDQIIELIKFANANKSVLVINDLERNPLAYYSIKFLTKLFSKSHLVKNDAPLSVLRGFKKNEWKEILLSSGAKNCSVKNKWAFRHEVIIYPDGK